jgi:hypothetical protein
MTRLFSAPGSRRQSIGALVAVALAVVLPGVAGGKERTEQGTKIQNEASPNGFGCLDVGQRCKNADECCSGRCRGKGKKHCKAHDTGGCKAGEGLCGQAAVPCRTSTGKDGECATTTGNAGFCQDNGGCQVCTRDRDCQIASNTRAAACIVCSACAEGTACVVA